MKQVAFLVPTCSYNLPDSPVHEQHLVKIFIKSLLSYTPDFDIRIFIGYNDDDKVYCNKDNRVKISSDIYDNCHIHISWYEFKEEAKGKPTWIWNELAQNALVEGYEYMFACGDDIQFPKQKEWLGVMIKKLKSTQNLGIAGGDSGNPNLPMTQFLFHKRHLEIFGFVFPPLIHNHYCDNWLLEVYPKKYVHYCEQYKLWNLGGKPRYNPKNDRGLCDALVKRYRPTFIRHVCLIE
mgnify:FL=1